MINNLDREILLWIHAHHHPVATFPMMGISYAGEAAACWWAIGLLMIARRHPRARQMLAAFLISLVVGVAFTNLPQMLWHRQRPYLYLEGIHQLGVAWQTSAFPSGHTVTSFSAAAIYGCVSRKFGICLFVFAGLMAFSRLYAGMHHPSDVLFAAVAGVACGWLSCRLAEAALSAPIWKRLHWEWAKAKKRDQSIPHCDPGPLIGPTEVRPISEEN